MTAGAQGLKAFRTSIYAVMRMRVEYVARVKCREAKKYPDGRPYLWCWVTVPQPHKEKLNGKWVKVILEVIE